MPDVNHLDMDNAGHRALVKALGNLDGDQGYLEPDLTCYKVWDLNELTTPRYLSDYCGAIAEWPNGSDKHATVSLFKSRSMFEAVFANITACAEKV